MLDLDRFDESPHLLDILLQMEDVLDSLDLYVFKNWFSGQVVEGPNVHRYWLTMVLRYPMNKMPDPKGAKRLLRQNILVEYQRVNVSDKTSEEEAKAAEQGGEDKAKPNHWQITISIPRRLVSDMNAAELDFYDEDIDADDVQDAQDSGMNDESGYHEDEQNPGAAPDAGDTDPNGTSAAPGGNDAINF